MPPDVTDPLKSSAIKVLEDCCDALERSGYKYMLSCGTLLGAFREKGFIPHDNDLDVQIIGEVNAKTMNKIFSKMGMILGRKVTYKNAVQQLVYYCPVTKVVFDVCVFRIIDGQAFCYPEEDCAHIHDAKYYNELDSIKLYGRFYPAPRPIEDWLKMHYGPNWSVPSSFKGRWQDECFDLKKLEVPSKFMRLLFSLRELSERSF
jgi:hypothetical protein